MADEDDDESEDDEDFCADCLGTGWVVDEEDGTSVPCDVCGGTGVW